ncbi:hypothetical protein [Metabacillus iocasae]|uniref:Membrane protein n=1 Tax=Priestia iocasae TaxID=2291674 RepID=A0ABS2QU48_9BACI|nr:hypothetical protein [Metabacillus iocasae]MBM7702990.1 putative membrane protein [Metabacillus iocasae]
MAFIIAIGVPLLFAIVSYLFTKEKSTKIKWITWGLVTMFVFTPFISWLIAIPFGILQKDGFVAIGLMMLLLPLFFLIGLIVLLIGIFKKKDVNVKNAS